MPAVPRATGGLFGVAVILVICEKLHLIVERKIRRAYAQVT
jgi:hypothetical protein